MNLSIKLVNKWGKPKNSHATRVGMLRSRARHKSDDLLLFYYICVSLFSSKAINNFHSAAWSCRKKLPNTLISQITFLDISSSPQQTQYLFLRIFPCSHVLSLKLLTLFLIASRFFVIKKLILHFMIHSESTEKHDEVAKVEEIPKKDSGLWRDLVSYWIFGLCNNFGYVVMLTAAHAIIELIENKEHIGEVSLTINFNLNLILHFIITSLISSLT